MPEINLDEELDYIQSLPNVSNSSFSSVGEKLINDDFTYQNISRELTHKEYSIIHLKTHGNFDYDPKKTYIVAASRELIRGERLSALIRKARESSGEALELLVLSACSTARGDNRTVFGLAGLATKAGVRSALSTLWEVDVDPNTEFMKSFYQELSKPGISKAEAFQKAQISLKNIEKDIKVWASYVLIGSWF